MIEFLCKICDRSFIENESDFQDYQTNLRKRNDKNLFKKYTINNIKVDEFDKKLNDYITTRNRKFDFYFF